MSHPAYLIPLTDKDLALLGELVVILGQIEEEMVLAVSGLIQADRPTTEKVMGATKVSDKAGIWSSLIKLRTKENEILHRWVDYVMGELPLLSQDRNDFIHANWHHKVRVSMMNEGRSLVQVADLTMRFPGGTVEPSKEPRAVARRIQNAAKSRSGEDLKAVRDRASDLSCVVAHIGHCLTSPDDPEGLHSTWRDRLPPLPDPRPAKREARRGKGRKAPPESSQG